MRAEKAPHAPVKHRNLGCLPAALCEPTLPEVCWPFWAAVLLLWTALWLALVGVGDL